MRLSLKQELLRKHAGLGMNNHYWESIRMEAAELPGDLTGGIPAEKDKRRHPSGKERS